MWLVYWVICRGPESRKPTSFAETPTLQTCPNAQTPNRRTLRTSYRRNMRGVRKLPALIARGFSSTSIAIRPAKGGDGAVRTSRVPDGPGLAYFVESNSRKGGDQGSLPQGESQLLVCPYRYVGRGTRTESERWHDDAYAVLAMSFAVCADIAGRISKSANRQLSLYFIISEDSSETCHDDSLTGPHPRPFPRWRSNAAL